MLMNSGTKPVDSKNKLLTTVAWQQGGPLEYAIEGGVFVGGAVVSWLRDGLGIIKSSADVEKLASSVPDSGGVVLVPAFVGLGAPHWDPYARGTIVGITRGTTAAHIARAGVESVALQVADLADAMGRDAGRPLSELRVDGGASVNNALLQYQSDVMQLPIVRPKVTETTAIGAAYLAGLATGVWKGRDEIAQHWQVDRRCEPKMSADQAASIRARWANAVERSRGWAKH
jgi:glycerol kinase